MKKNLFLLFCVFAMVAACLVSCGGEDHVHTFGEEWYSDETGHWHPAGCEHGEIKDGFAEHADAEEDGLCDVCDFEIGHECTFESTWQTDETHHWKKATCSHADTKGEYGFHTDEDMDSLCETCSAHVHNVNPIGFCTYDDCGIKVRDVDESDLGALINAVYFQQHLVNGGHVDHEMFGRSNHLTDGFNTHRVETVEYLFGANGYTYRNVHTITTGEAVAESDLTGWYQPDGDGTFGMVSPDKGLSFELDISDPNKLFGHYFALSTIADGHGAEALLVSLYDQFLVAQENDCLFDVVITTDPENNTANFSFSILSIGTTTIANGDNAGEVVYNVNLYRITGSLSYTDDFALTSLDLDCDCFTNDPGAMPDGSLNKEDVSLQYDPETHTYIFVEYDADNDTFVESENPIYNTYSFSITQTVGERTEENPNPKSKFVPDSFELYLNKDDSNNLYNKYTGTTIVAKLREIINFYISDYSPENTSLHYVTEYVSFKLYLNGEEIEDADDYANSTAVAMFTFSGQLRSFFIVPKTAGVYTFEIYFMGEMTHSATINVGTIKEEDIQLEDNQFAVNVTEAHEWANEVTFTATEAGNYTFHLPYGLGFIDADGFDAADKTPATDDTPNPYYDYNAETNPDGSYIPGEFTITLEAGESIRFYTMAAKKGTYVIDYEIG